MAAKEKSVKSAPGINWTGLLMSIFLIALGVCSFVWPGLTAAAVCTAIGVAVTLFGLFKIIWYFTHPILGVGQNYDFSFGLIAIIAGLVLIIFDTGVTKLFQQIIGAYLIIDSALKLQAAVDAKRLGLHGWWLSLLLALVCAALGVALFFDFSGDLLMVVIGVGLIADGLQNLVVSVFSFAGSRAVSRREASERAAEIEAEAPAAEAPADAPVEVPSEDEKEPVAVAAGSGGEEPQINDKEKEKHD